METARYGHFTDQKNEWEKPRMLKLNRDDCADSRDDTIRTAQP